MHMFFMYWDTKSVLLFMVSLFLEGGREEGRERERREGEEGGGKEEREGEEGGKEGGV